LSRNSCGPPLLPRSLLRPGRLGHNPTEERHYNREYEPATLHANLAEPFIINLRTATIWIR